MMVPKETLSQLGPDPFQLGTMDWLGWGHAETVIVFSMSSPSSPPGSNGEFETNGHTNDSG